MAVTGRKKLPVDEIKIPFPIKRRTAEKLRCARALGKGVDEALDKLADKLLIAMTIEL